MRQKKHNLSQGATLVELLIVMAIVGIFTRLVTLNVFRGQQRASLTVSRDALVSDIRKQQHRAMEGSTSAPGLYLDYSIRFEQNRYILFPGVVFDENNGANEVIGLDPILAFDPAGIPGGVITFARLSGEVRDYDPNMDRITLANTQTNDAYVIRFNKYGVPFVQ